MWRHVLVLLMFGAVGPFFSGVRADDPPEYQGCVKEVQGSFCGPFNVCFCIYFSGNCSSVQQIPKFKHLGSTPCQEEDTGCFELWTQESQCYKQKDCRITGGNRDCRNGVGCETYGEETSSGPTITEYRIDLAVDCEYEPM